MSEEKRPRTSILAIASMVMGIMTVTFGPVTGIPAIILAVVTLFLISKAKGRLSGREYAKAGLVLAAVIIPIRYRAAEVYQKRLTPVCLNNIQRVSLSRDDEGVLRIRRIYGFEHSDTGDNRHTASIVMLGNRVLVINLCLPGAPQQTMFH